MNLRKFGCILLILLNLSGCRSELLSSGSVMRSDGTGIHDKYGIPADLVRRADLVLGKHPASGFEYPWRELENTLAAEKNEKLLLIGYGSLLNPESAARTIKDTPPEGHPPVLAFGAQRLFNYLIPDERIKSYGGNYGPRERAALNLLYTRSAANIFNGRLLTVDIKDIPALRTREFGYDLLPVVAVKWNHWNEEPFIAYVLVARKEIVNGRHVLDPQALPHPLYAQVCRAGAKMVSDSFLKMYLDTTYLADRVTVMSSWEGKNPGKYENALNEVH
ncbi:MAG: hypothetical protein QM760_20300 [Nibricoccus sp.]